MPGMKDFVSIRSDDGNRIHVQKRLILSNLKELYQCFCEINPTGRIGFSKFASLRPKHCVLAGASGTHTICVCTIHQNVKLMMLGANIYSLTRNTEKPIKHYSDYLSMIICENPSFQCYLGGCKNCPGVDELSEILLKCFEDREIENITYKYWISKPRSSLETIIKPTEEFVEKFCSELEILLPHSFIAKEQAQFLKTLKETLKPNEYVIICDFAENYAFVVQNAAAGFHWNNQATVFPVVIYYTVNNKLEHKSLVIISDSNKHDAVAVHVFIEIITDYVKSLPERCNKIYYFSDGAPQQFKNFKNFVNLYYHEDDFDIPAEWHFFATAHGKGPCGGIGGILKRLAARASLQLAVDKHITTPEELFEWASAPDNLPNIIVKFSPEEDYDTATSQDTHSVASSQNLLNFNPTQASSSSLYPQLSDDLLRLDNSQNDLHNSTCYKNNIDSAQTIHNNMNGVQDLPNLTNISGNEINSVQDPLDPTNANNNYVNIIQNPGNTNIATHTVEEVVRQLRSETEA
ncbi:uncharacterized protein LOC141525460 [Cotesia typhae]|uniref:uncharacterized protein LOC141525460 n=1 Tax=Cotesia typhae TaxID=2053667 RepID=UPI003D69F2DE